MNLKIINMLEKLDKLADELYSEFGFATCSSDQQELILQEFIQRGYYLVSIESQYNTSQLKISSKQIIYLSKKCDIRQLIKLE